MSEPFIPYGRQWVEPEDILTVSEVLRSDYLTTGPVVGRYEKALADYAGIPHAVTVNSGTAALHAAYFAAGLGPGDEIITTPLTFAATANAALYLGAKVKFVDVLPETGTIDPAGIEAAVNDRTRCVVPVDYAGHPAEYDEIHAIARKHGLTVISDAAHSLGATYRGRKVGTLADATATSFHPVKPITTGEGGAVLTHVREWAARAAVFRNHGILRDVEKGKKGEGDWYYEMQELGYNYRLTDIQCALGISQLRKLDRFVSRRREIAAVYDQAFREVRELILPASRDYVGHGRHLYVIRLSGDPKLRLPFFERLRKSGLGVQVHYIPVNSHPYYRERGYDPAECPKALEFYRRAVSLPIYPKMTDPEVQTVIDRVLEAVRAVL